MNLQEWVCKLSLSYQKFIFPDNLCVHTENTVSSFQVAFLLYWLSKLDVEVAHATSDHPAERLGGQSV
jgi:hypothetical protein